MKSKNNLKILVNWINNLENEKKDYAKKYFNFNCIYGLDDEDYLKLKELRNIVVNMFIDFDKDKILKKLMLSGLNEEISTLIYENCESNIQVLTHTRILNEIDIEKLSKVIDFVIEKMFIYFNEYNLYPIEYVTKTIGLSSIDEMRVIISFLFFTYTRIATKSNSLESQSLILDRVYGVEKSRIDIIINKVKDKTEIIQKSYLLCQFHKFMSVIETEDDSNNNDVD
jgi:hypothetical protein